MILLVYIVESHEFAKLLKICSAARPPAWNRLRDEFTGSVPPEALRYHNFFLQAALISNLRNAVLADLLELL